jgi:hypothetical protein
MIRSDRQVFYKYGKIKPSMVSGYDVEKMLSINDSYRVGSGRGPD